jgi:hypothetical protein
MSKYLDYGNTWVGNHLKSHVQVGSIDYVEILVDVAMSSSSLADPIKNKDVIGIVQDSLNLFADVFFLIIKPLQVGGHQ